MLQLLQHYFGIKVKIRKNRIFHCFFYFWPWSRNNYVMIPTTLQFPVNYTPKNYTSKFNFEKKNFDFRKGPQVRSQNRENDHFGMSGRFFFFFFLKESLSCRFLGWNLLEITVMLQSFHYYFGITVKIRKKRIFHCFFYFWPWSRNNYVMIPTTLQFPVNFTPKNYTSKLNFEKKKFSIPERGLCSVSKSANDHLGMSDGNFFFSWKKKMIVVFFGVKFTGDYRDVSIISSLFRYYSQNSRKQNFSSFFLFLTVIPK